MTISLPWQCQLLTDDDNNVDAVQRESYRHHNVTDV